jgi:FMN reductase
MTLRKLAVVSAGLSQPSSTRMLSDRLAEATVRRLTERGIETQVDFVELRDIARDVTNNLIAGFPSPALNDVIETVTGADGLIAVTPIFTTSYSGLFKSFFDVIEPTALDGMPVLIGATGGTERHSLALDYAMRPMFTYLHGIVVPTSVYAASVDWAGAGSGIGAGSGAGSGIGAGASGAHTGLQDRVERAAGELAALVAVSDRSMQIRDPFALDGTFAASIGGFEAD